MRLVDVPEGFLPLQSSNTVNRGSPPDGTAVSKSSFSADKYNRVVVSKGNMLNQNNDVYK